MDPALADERHVADDARRGEAGEVAHDRVLQFLRLVYGQPPVLRVRDHVAHVEVVRHDLRLIQQREAEVQQGRLRVVHTPHQDTLVADVAEAHVEQLPHGLGHERRHRVGVVDVCVDREVDVALVGLLGQALHAGEHLVLQEVLGYPHEPLGGEPDVADVLDVEQRSDELLEVRDREIRDVPAGDDDVADRGGLAQVLEDRLVTVLLLHLEAVLDDLRDVVADEVHARAVTAVLGAGRQQLGQHLRRVTMGESLDRPHVGLVEAVALGKSDGSATPRPGPRTPGSCSGGSGRPTGRPRPSC